MDKSVKRFIVFFILAFSAIYLLWPINKTDKAYLDLMVQMEPRLRPLYGNLDTKEQYVTNARYLFIKTCSKSDSCLSKI